MEAPRERIRSARPPLSAPCRSTRRARRSLSRRHSSSHRRIPTSRWWQGTFDLGGLSSTVYNLQQTGGTIQNGTITGTTAFDMQAGTASAVLAWHSGSNKDHCKHRDALGHQYVHGGHHDQRGARSHLSSSTTAISASSGVSIAAGATLSLSASESIKALSSASGTASVTLGANTLTITGTTTTTFAGGHQRQRRASRSRAAAASPSRGPNTYTGTTTVSAGTLTLGAASALATTSSLVVSGGTFDLGTYSITVAGVCNRRGERSRTGRSPAPRPSPCSGGHGKRRPCRHGGAEQDNSGHRDASPAPTPTRALQPSAPGTLAVTSNNALGTTAGGTTVASGATLDFNSNVSYSTAEPLTVNGGHHHFIHGVRTRSQTG